MSAVASKTDVVTPAAMDIRLVDYHVAGINEITMIHKYLLWYTDIWSEVYKQGKSEGLDSCDRPGNLTRIGLKSLIFQAVWPWNLMDDPEK